MIKNIVFDMGRVLVVYEPKEFVKKLEYKNEEEIDYITNHIFLSDIWKDMDAGIISTKEGHKKIEDTIDDKYKKSAKFLVEKWWTLRGPVEGMPDLVKQLYEKGYNLYLLSNASDNHSLYWKELPYKKYFKELYVSSYYKKIKPNRDIYEDFINKFNLKKEECLFIDDTKINVDVANDFGIKSHVFVGKEELIDYLKNQNII